MTGQVLRGRSAQKARTRQAIVKAAHELAEPTIEAAADKAGVSRATAYRYFPTQEALSVELASGTVWTAAEAVVSGLKSPSVEHRLARVVDAVVDAVANDERQVRTALRVYHDTWLRDPASPVRKGRRREWIERVVEPLPEAVRERLRTALTLVVGPDLVTMLKDVSGLDAAATKSLLTWAGLALIRAATTEAEVTPREAAAGRGSAGTKGSAVRRKA